MAAVNAGSASVTPTTQATPATALWTPHLVWPRTARSVTAVVLVNAGAANAPTLSSRVRRVRSVPPALACAQSTSKILFSGWRSSTLSHCVCCEAGLVWLSCHLCFLRECVQCRAFEAGEKKNTCEQECGYFQLIKVKDREKLPQPTDQSFPLTHCKERDANDCWFYYTYAVRNDTKEVYVVETLGEYYVYKNSAGVTVLQYLVYCITILPFRHCHFVSSCFFCCFTF